MDKRIKYSDQVRHQAADLFSKGYSYRSVARVLGVPLHSAKTWRDQYRFGGLLVLDGGVKNKTYSFEQKLAAVQAFEAGDSWSEVLVQHQITNRSLLFRWVRDYRALGPDGLRPKKRGRPSASQGEETLEQKVQRLEMENAVLKKLQALVVQTKKRPGRSNH